MFDLEQAATESRTNAQQWQMMLRKWQGLIGFGPFVVFIFVSLKFFPDAKANWLWLTMVVVTVIWAVAVPGYCLYLRYLD